MLAREAQADDVAVLALRLYDERDRVRGELDRGVAGWAGGEIRGGGLERAREGARDVADERDGRGRRRGRLEEERGDGRDVLRRRFRRGRGC